MLQARDRFSGGRIVAAMAMTLAGLGAVNVHFQVSPPTINDEVGLLYLCGGLVGLIAGWKHLGTRLGRGFMSAATWGAVAAALATLYGLIAAALRDMLGVYGFSKFDTVMELVNYLVIKAMDFGAMILEPRQVSAILVGGVLAGIFAEHYQRIWR